MRRRSWPCRAASIAILACVTAASGALPVIAHQATPVSTATAAASCTEGSSSIGDAYFPMMGNSGYDAIHYDLAFTVDPVSAAIDPAVATVSATALLDLCAFNLDFRGMTVEAITVDGQPAAWERFGLELRITPAAPIPRGAGFTVEVAYHGTPDGRFADPISVFQEQLAQVLSGSPVPDLAEATPSTDESGYFSYAPFDRPLLPPSARTPTPGVVGGIVAGETTGLGGYYSTGESVFVAGEPWGAEAWYPVNAHPADKATYTLRITIPAADQVVANGRLIDRIEHGDSTTWVWEARDPIASYLVTFHAGQLEIEEFTGPNGLPYLLAFHPATPEAQRAAFRRLPEIMAVFEELFGPYPFESAGATVVGSAIPFALETQTLPVYGAYPEIPGHPMSPEFTDAYMEMVAHELAHQWFGDSASVLRWQDIWLNEGFATYAQALWLERSQGVEARDAMLDGLRQQAADLEAFTVPERIAERSAFDLQQAIELSLGEDSPLATDYRDALGAASDEDLAALPAADGLAALQSLGVAPEMFPGTIAPLGDPGPDLLFSPQLTYARGALTLHALRQEIGDEAFFDLLRAWTSRYQQGNATTADFVSLAETTANRDLTAFFDTWLYSFGGIGG